MTKQQFWNWFYNSSSILWARAQVLFGCIVLVITTTDMSPWLPAKYLPIWVVINGIISEYLRRTNTKTENIVVSDTKGVTTDVTYLKPPNPVPQGAILLQQTSSDSPKSDYSVAAMIGTCMLLVAASAGIFVLINSYFLK